MAKESFVKVFVINGLSSLVSAQANIQCGTIIKFNKMSDSFGAVIIVMNKNLTSIEKGSWMKRIYLLLHFNFGNSPRLYMAMSSSDQWPRKVLNVAGLTELCLGRGCKNLQCWFAPHFSCAPNRRFQHGVVNATFTWRSSKSWIMGQIQCSTLNHCALAFQQLLESTNWQFTP